MITRKFAIAIITSANLLLLGAAVNAAELQGKYEGWYYAEQGQTGLTLTVNDDGTGVFEFYNMPNKTNAENGSYTVKVTEENGTYTVEGVDWIDQPSGYRFVSLNGVLNDTVFEGDVSTIPNCTFKLMKDTADYETVKETVFANHRYEVIEKRMNWDEAKAYCESLGGHLVTINSAEEQAYIENLLSDYPDEDYMIGTHRNLGEFTQWVTGESISYSNWGNPQPDNLGGSQNVGVICNGKRSGGSYNIEKGQWDDNSNRSYKFICEWDTWSNAAEWSTPELKKAAELNLIPDVIIGEDMSQPITRGEFAAVAVNLYEAMTGGRTVMSSEAGFKDISNNKNRNYILKAYNIDVVRGYSEESFAPESLIQREELATMLARVYKKSEWSEWTIENDDNYTINYSGVKKFADDAEISDYAKPSVYFLVKYNVLNGIGNDLFAPKNSTSAQAAIQYANATREQAIVMALRSFENFKD